MLYDQRFHMIVEENKRKPTTRKTLIHPNTLNPSSLHGKGRLGRSISFFFFLSSETFLHSWNSEIRRRTSSIFSKKGRESGMHNSCFSVSIFLTHSHSFKGRHRPVSISSETYSESQLLLVDNLRSPSDQSDVSHTSSLLIPES